MRFSYFFVLFATIVCTLYSVAVSAAPYGSRGSSGYPNYPNLERRGQATVSNPRDVVHTVDLHKRVSLFARPLLKFGMKLKATPAPPALPPRPPPALPTLQRRPAQYRKPPPSPLQRRPAQRRPQHQAEQSNSPLNDLPSRVANILSNGAWRRSDIR
ncbi:hypothetical protein BC835DRAFT_731588 [Cytidiella melzeri]|nr:hypothetical protein BC835DRAFT_731588 [Cytidiella melzeri]